MQKEIITNNAEETQKLGVELAREIKNSGGVVCLSGDLGSGKTTFAQGFLKELGAEGPYTSPTFMIMKEYLLKTNEAKKLTKLKAVYHFDVYRVKTEDVLSLGWEEIMANPKNIVIIEWAERIKKIVPREAIWIKFEWKGERERIILFSDDQFASINLQ